MKCIAYILTIVLCSFLLQTNAQVKRNKLQIEELKSITPHLVCSNSELHVWDKIFRNNGVRVFYIDGFPHSCGLGLVCDMVYFRYTWNFKDNMIPLDILLQTKYWEQYDEMMADVAYTHRSAFEDSGFVLLNEQVSANCIQVNR